MTPNTYVVLRSGNPMPVLGLGTWELTDNTATAVASALRLGYRMIDTSGDYGTQPGIAEGIRKSGVDRADFYLTTKIEETDDAWEATRKNLEELETSHADLMLIHRPPDTGAGKDLWRGLIRARDIGVSNYPADLIDDLVDATGEVPAVNQVEWSPFGHSDEMQRYAEKRGIVIQAYSPLTRGTRLDDPALAVLAEKYGRTPAQLLLRWNLQRGTVPLPKASAEEHREENLAVFDFELVDEDMAALDALNEHYSSLGELPYA